MHVIDIFSVTDADETAKYDITVKGVEISPNPVVRGHPTNMIFNLIIGTFRYSPGPIHHL